MAELRTLLFLTIWLFTWDVEIDEPTGFCSDDFAKAQQYRQQTVDLLRTFFGLSS